MFSRYFFALCALGLCIGAANVNAAEVPKVTAELESKLNNELKEAEDQLERSLIDEIIKLLEEYFVGAAKNCLKEAAQRCKKYIIRPKKLVECAKEYFKENQGECIIPERR